MKTIIINDEIVKDEQYRASDVEEVIFTKNVKYVGSRAFAWCTELKKVTFAGESIELGWGCFERCKSLTSIKLPKMRFIPYKCFSCSGLREIEFPDNLVSIDAYAFRGCKFTALNFPESLKSIGSCAFSYSGKYITIHFKNVEHLGDGAFKESKIDSLTIGRDINYIPPKAFGGCDLKYVRILEAICDDNHGHNYIMLDWYSFYGNPRMTIKLPKRFNYKDSTFWVNDHPYFLVHLKDPYKNMKILFPSPKFCEGNIYTNRVLDGHRIPYDFYNSEDDKENK